MQKIVFFLTLLFTLHQAQSMEEETKTQTISENTSLCANQKATVILQPLEKSKINLTIFLPETKQEITTDQTTLMLNKRLDICPAFAHNKNMFAVAFSSQKPYQQTIETFALNEKNELIKVQSLGLEQPTQITSFAFDLIEQLVVCTHDEYKSNVTIIKEPTAENNQNIIISTSQPLLALAFNKKYPTFFAGVAADDSLVIFNQKDDTYEPTYFTPQLPPASNEITIKSASHIVIIDTNFFITAINNNSSGTLFLWPFDDQKKPAIKLLPLNAAINSITTDDSATHLAVMIEETINENLKKEKVLVYRIQDLLNFKQGNSTPEPRVVFASSQDTPAQFSLARQVSFFTSITHLKIFAPFYNNTVFCDIHLLSTQQEPSSQKKSPTVSNNSPAAGWLSGAKNFMTDLYNKFARFSWRQKAGAACVGAACAVGAYALYKANMRSK